MSCEHAFEDGAYVLGALSPAERSRFEMHLAECQECRDAVAGLAVLPGLLRRLSPEVATGTATGDADGRERLPKVVSSVTALRKRDRRRTVGMVLVAACVALFAGLAAGSARQPVVPDVRPTLDMVAMRPVAKTKVTAEVTLTEGPQGTTVRMRCTYPPSATYTKAYAFRLVAVGQEGVAEQVGSWMAGPGDEVAVTGTVQLALKDITRLELRAKDGTPLLVYEVPANP